MKAKGRQKDADICHSTQVKFWFKYPQYLISIIAKELRFAHDLQ